VQELIKLFREGWLRSDLAKKFKLPHCTVSRVLEERGELKPKERLSEGAVRSIRAMRKTGKLQRDIALAHNVSIVTVSNICSGKAWANVEDLPDVVNPTA